VAGRAALVTLVLCGLMLPVGSGTAAAQYGGPVGPEAPSNTTPPSITGVPKVHQLLIATPGEWGASAPRDFAFRWLRCRWDRGDCLRIPGATRPTYRVRMRDVGARLKVRVTAVVGAGAATRESTLTAVVRPALPLMQPFPVVRVKGFFTGTGAVLQLVSVTAPEAARTAVSCRGGDCPSHGLSKPATGPSRLTVLERAFRAGTRLKFRITQPAVIGKYTSIVIRAGGPPERRDRCLIADRGEPVRCPAGESAGR
jgi:hypothetical protein